MEIPNGFIMDTQSGLYYSEQLIVDAVTNNYVRAITWFNETDGSYNTVNYPTEQPAPINYSPTPQQPVMQYNTATVAGNATNMAGNMSGNAAVIAGKSAKPLIFFGAALALVVGFFAILMSFVGESNVDIYYTEDLPGESKMKLMLFEEDSSFEIYFQEDREYYNLYGTYIAEKGQYLLSLPSDFMAFGHFRDSMEMIVDIEKDKTLVFQKLPESFSLAEGAPLYKSSTKYVEKDIFVPEESFHASYSFSGNYGKSQIVIMFSLDDTFEMELLGNWVGLEAIPSVMSGEYEVKKNKIICNVTDANDDFSAIEEFSFDTNEDGNLYFEDSVFESIAEAYNLVRWVDENYNLFLEEDGID